MSSCATNDETGDRVHRTKHGANSRRTSWQCRVTPPTPFTATNAKRESVRLEDFAPDVREFFRDRHCRPRDRYRRREPMWSILNCRVAEFLVHRIGRTARAGSGGIAMRSAILLSETRWVDRKLVKQELPPWVATVMRRPNRPQRASPTGRASTRATIGAHAPAA